jgi:hypothetical protein
VWKFWARPDFFDELSQRPLPERKAVRDALAALLDDPFDPPNLVHYSFRGVYEGDLRCADLPYD